MDYEEIWCKTMWENNAKYYGNYTKICINVGK